MAQVIQGSKVQCKNCAGSGVSIVIDGPGNRLERVCGWCKGTGRMPAGRVRLA